VDLYALVNFASIRAWLVVLGHAIRMAPHPAARPGASEAARMAFFAKVVTLILLALWFARRLDAMARTTLDALRAKAQVMMERADLPMPPALRLLDDVLWQPAVPEGLKAQIDLWPLPEYVHVAVLCGAMLLVARLLRPRMPRLPAIALGLSALATASVYSAAGAYLVTQLGYLLGIPAALDAAVGADGLPRPGFEAALNRLLVLGVTSLALGLLPIIGLVTCLARGLRRAGHRRAPAIGAALFLWLMPSLAAVLASHTTVASILVRAVSFAPVKD
jgi:hypothetical protein